MPELPEVETVCQALRPILVGQSLHKVKFNRPDLRYPLPLDLEQKVSRQVVTSVERRAKYILVNFANNLTLMWHLGMSGRVIINNFSISSSFSPTDSLHDHVIFMTSREDKITFRDPRRFGFMTVAASDELSRLSPFNKLGPEPLDDSLTASVFHNRLARKSVSLKNALLDQHILAGLGNIYVSEALWQAKLSPLRLTCSLTLNETAALLEQIRDVLNRAIASGGSSLRDHIQPNGESGYFQHYFKVYNRKNEPCSHCSVTPVVKINQGGRATYYCPRCQI